jgi:nicotinamide-nucleotide amidase
MKAAVIAIGDELLIGQVINSNAAFIAEKLDAAGISVEEMITVGDDEEAIVNTLHRSLSEHDVLCLTGGLGPTHDDLTRSAICKFFKTDLILNEEALENVRRIIKRRNVPPTKLNEEQALVPRGCDVLQNSHGTAPGYFFHREGKHVAVMPGVPHEMKAMMEHYVAPYFQEHPVGQVIRHRTIMTTGIPESFLFQQLGNLDELLEGAKLAFLPAPTGVRLRISVKEKDEATANRKLQRVEEGIRKKAAKYIYGVEDEELEQVLGRMLTERKLTIAVAESCTGGLIADKITDVSGSSNYFERAIISYSNQSKVESLKVRMELIETHGAVSNEVAKAMAEGVRQIAGTDIGISTTGIAGPTGGSPEKPVGLVWIGYSDKNETLAVKFNFGDDRRRVKERAAQAALELVRRRLLKIE